MRQHGAIEKVILRKCHSKRNQRLRSKYLLRKILFGLLLLLFSYKSNGEIYPSLGSSLSITPDTSIKNETEIFFDFSGSLEIPLSEDWTLASGYALGVNSISGASEVFSSPFGSIGWMPDFIGKSWKIKPGYAATLSHQSDFSSQKATLSFIHFFDENEFILSFGPTLYADSEKNRKLGGFGGLSGIFTEPWFWYLDLVFSAQLVSSAPNRIDRSITIGTGYDITKHFSLSFDASIYRGPSGLAIQQGTTQAIVMAKKPSKTVSPTQRPPETEITYTGSLDYSF